MLIPGPDHEYKDGQEGFPPTAWIAVACRQFGNYCMISQYFNDAGVPYVKLRLPPDMLESHRQRVLERAWFLDARDASGMPTEMLPDGSWPDSWSELGDGVTLNVVADHKAKTVVMDLGRAVRAVDLHPAQARVLSTMLQMRAMEVDADGQAVHENPAMVGVAMVTEADGIKRQAKVIAVLNGKLEVESELDMTGRYAWQLTEKGRRCGLESIVRILSVKNDIATVTIHGTVKDVSFDRLELIPLSPDDDGNL